MVRDAKQEIRQVMNQPGAGIREYNQLIETLTEAAMAGGMPRHTVLQLTLTSTAALAAGGRREAAAGWQFAAYKGVEGVSRGANGMLEAFPNGTGRSRR